MKTPFWTLVAAALLLAGCSKEELTENVTEGASLVATSTNGNARLGAAGNQPSVKFKNGRIVIGLNNTKTEEEVPLDAILSQGGGSVVLTDHETTPPMVFELPLENTNGNGNQRYRTPPFEMGADMEGELFEIAVNGPDGAYLWGANIFVREDGKAVENDPTFHRGRIGNWDIDDTAAQDLSNARLTIVVADDPTNAVASIKVVSGPIYPYPDDPTYAILPEPFFLIKTHENTNIGLSKWRVHDIMTDGVGLVSSYLLSGQSYNVPFLTPETNTKIIGKYMLSVDQDGSVSAVLSDEPEILGSRLGSTSFGEQWQLEIAIADLGDWVETVNYVFEPGEGPAPFVSELPMQLTRTDGNLRVYTSGKFSFNGNPIGNDVGGTVYIFGSGNRGTAVRTNSRTELL